MNIKKLHPAYIVLSLPFIVIYLVFGFGVGGFKVVNIAYGFVGFVYFCLYLAGRMIWKKEGAEQVPKLDFD